MLLLTALRCCCSCSISLTLHSTKNVQRSRSTDQREGKETEGEIPPRFHQILRPSFSSSSKFSFLKPFSLPLLSIFTNQFASCNSASVTNVSNSSDNKSQSQRQPQQQPRCFPHQILQFEKLNCGYIEEPTLQTKFPATLAVMTRAWSLPTYHDFLAAAPRCMQDLCWIPQARAYSIGIYVNEKHLDMVIEKETEAYLKELKAEGGRENREGDKNQQTLPVTDNIGCLTDDELVGLAARITSVVFEPEIEKTFCFIFVSQGDIQHITGGFTRVFFNAAKNINSHEFDFGTFEITIQAFCTLLKRTDINRGSTLLVTCNPSLPPLSSLIFAPDADSALEHIGGVSGSTINMLLHKLYLKDPYSSQNLPYYPGIAARLKRETQERILALLKEKLQRQE